MPEVRQLAAQALQHGLVVEVAEDLGYHHHLALGVGEHVLHLVLAEDRHQRVAHRTDAHAGHEQGAHLPPVGQLAGHHVAFLDPQRRQAGGHAGDAPVQLAVAHGATVAGMHPVTHQGSLLRCFCDRHLQVICNDHVIPGAACVHLGTPPFVHVCCYFHA
ncbi:hypothetical protein D3C75_1007750 [compost metagenome]